MIKILLVHLMLHCTFKFIYCGETLDQHNTGKELDPLYDASKIALKREHDKRTVFSSGVQNYGWAKHIGHHPSGFRYVIGYGPVDLKYVPVLRQPIKFVSHLHSHRLRWPQKFTKPLLPIRPIHDHGWKPTQPVVKPISVRPVVPVVPVVKPVGVVVKPVVPIVPHDPQWPNKLCQDEWKQKPVIANPVHPITPVNVVHFQHGVKPFPPPQLAPAPPPVAPVFPIRPIFSLQHFVPTQPISPAHPVQVPNPWVPSVKPAYPLVPQHQFFEVSKPNLPVLPLGATFPSPILQQAPPGSGVIVQNPPPIHQNPRPLVEYHGTHNFVPVNGFINFPKLASIQPQYATQFLQTHQPAPAPTLIHSGGQIQQNPLQSFVPQLSGTQHSTHFPQTQQQLSQVTNFQQLAQQGQQITDEQYQPPLAHGQLPLEGENSTPAQHNNFISSNNPNLLSQEEASYYNQNDVQQEQFHNSNSIQPGETDVQTPLYLPPHTGFNPQVETFNNYNLQLSSSQGDRFSDFRPSPSLEPPFNNQALNNQAYNRREDVETPKEENIGTPADDDHTTEQYWKPI